MSLGDSSNDEACKLIPQASPLSAPVEPEKFDDLEEGLSPQLSPTPL